MIPQAELEKAIARWKARQGGALLADAQVDAQVEEAEAEAEVEEYPITRAADTSGLISLDDAEIQQDS